MRTLWFDEALLPEGWRRDVAISIDESGLIAAVSCGARPDHQGEHHAVALPGMGNVHSHAFQRAIAGRTETAGPAADSFWTWRAQMYRFLDAMTPDDVEAITALAFMEMLEAGFTRVGEFHYLHHDPAGAAYANAGEMAERIGAAAATTGLGLTLLPVFYAHGNFGGAAPVHGQRRFICDINQFSDIVDVSRRVAGALPGGRVGIAPHSLRAATLAEIRTLLPLAGDGPVHIHVAEQVREVEDGIAATGRRPVTYLMDELPVDRRWCLIHATHVDAGEATRIAASGAVVGLCPVTEANLGDGIFPAADFLARGGRFGIGSDSNVAISVAGELRQMEYAQRLHHRSRNVLASGPGASTGRTLFDAAFAGGFQALGMEARGLAVGAPADLVSLDPARHVSAADGGAGLLDSWIFTDAPLIDCVWRQGVKLVAGGRHRDRDAITARCRAVFRAISQ